MMSNRWMRRGEGMMNEGTCFLRVREVCCVSKRAG
jgi:hypothetical protein